MSPELYHAFLISAAIHVISNIDFVTDENVYFPRPTNKSTYSAEFTKQQIAKDIYVYIYIISFNELNKYTARHITQYELQHISLISRTYLLMSSINRR